MWITNCTKEYYFWIIAFTTVLLSIVHQTTAYCKCGSKLTCDIQKCSDFNDYIVNCQIVNGIGKCGKPYLRNPIRKELGERMYGQHVEAFRSEQANEMMSRDGDPEAPMIRSASVLYNVKKEHLQQQYIRPNPLEALKILKYGELVNCIEDIGFDPFFVQYSTNDALQSYKKLCAKQTKTCVCIDSTAGVVKKLDTKTIFLHALAVGVPEGQFSVTHMLSEISHTQAICNWLKMWRRSGAPVPDACVTDWSKALLNGTTNAFTTFETVENYADSLNKRDLRTCKIFLRIDVAHTMKKYSQFFKTLRKPIKTFYLACIGQLIKCSSKLEARTIIENLLIVCQSETDGHLRGGNATACEDGRRVLMELITTAFVSCSPSPCKNGGTCFSSPKDDSFCNCTSKYVGEYCQYPNPCHTSRGPRCQNGGSCQVRVSPGEAPSFSCSCPLGFMASLCEIRIANSCDQKPCGNGGTCSLRSLKSYQCSCAPGYTGIHCEKQDHCASQPCRNGAECTSVGDSYKCTCGPGFTGASCREDKDECKQEPCHRGICHNTHGSYTCTCDEGYTGQNCESEYIPCDPSPCLNGGQCRQRDKHTYTCDCPSGFRGQNCEENIDDCPGHQCLNGGTCVDGINSYTCKCKSTYTGQFCEQDVDECSTRPSVCQNGATCTNSIGSFSCICVNGWTGPDCSVNIDDCAGAACFNGATCIDRVGSFYCRCTVGKTGLLCHLDDACTSNPCHADAICDTSPINGSYTCSCASGYKGTDCSEDIDECEQGSPCEHDGICVNTPGSFACNCTQGFTGPRCETNVNECESHPCHNDGSCLDDPGTFRCVCMPGFTGTQCEIDIDECKDKPCLNGGICHDLINSFKCSCATGFTGSRCQINIDDCLSNPCRNGGMCHDSIAAYTCECPPGFNGLSCETNINDCLSSPCLHGECIDGENSFTCTCHPGYSGTLCQHQINECESNPCQYGGTCQDLVNGYQCLCKPGTSGPNCEINVNECHSNPCRNSARCVDGINSYVCECIPGFTGRHCENDIDECSSNPCANGGVCIDLVNGFRCECPRGYFDARCLSDVDECKSNPCKHGGSCEDGVNQFICHCLPGYGGKQCEINIDECASNPCQHGGNCRDHLASYTCECIPGYSGINCEYNIDDCAINPCKNGGSCIDLVNDFKCVCEVPYTGRECQERLDPCQPNLCQHNAKCTPSSNFMDFACSCSVGYTGRFCEQDVDECVVSKPCRNGATCRNTNGSYMCICMRGYQGKDCATNTDDCASSPCQNGGTCLDEIGQFLCLCVNGFEGRQCEIDIDECSSNPCQNGATCNQYVNSYTCTCPLGFSGINCQTNDEDCTESSCMYGGTCIDGINTYICTCKPGYTGSNCQNRINLCDSSPCLNGAVCQDHTSHYTCHCPFGYTGKNCGEYVDWCATNPCENHSTCQQVKNQYSCSCGPGWTGKVCDVEMVSCKDAATKKGIPWNLLCNNGTCETIGNSHRCHCKEGYTGSYCQKEINECESAPCQNGATCKDLIGSYSCVCPKGFQGQNCELNVDDCKPNPCQNGGTCHDLVDSFLCSCPPGTLGYICEVNIDDCRPDSCHNNGTCIDQVRGFDCKCPPGFVGPRCEGDINECLSNPCSNPGTLDCVQLVNDYQCNCRSGYIGHHCERKVDICAGSPCVNGGVCIPTHYGHKCTCPEGFYGTRCEFSGYDCDSDPCKNGGVCRISDGGGYVCDCPPESTGINCEVDLINECDSNPCLHPDAVCQNKLGDYICYCPARHIGKNCEIYDRTAPAGVGKPVRPHQDFKSVYERDLEKQRQQCLMNKCPMKRGDMVCDEECNTYACDFDGQDCSLGINPYANCTAPTKCWQVFGDGKCNEDCNNPQCLFDGRDCEKKLQACNPIYDAYCQKHYANGYCDYGCNNAECNWDGLDCENEPPNLADGVISMVILMDMEGFKKNLVAFLRDTSHQLRTILVVKKDQLGNDMIYPWVGSTQTTNLQDYNFKQKHHIVYSEQAQTGVKVYLEIDNRKCSTMAESPDNCFQTASSAAEFLAAKASKHTLSSSFPIYQVNGSTGLDEDENPPANAKYVLIGVLLVIVLCSVVFLIVQQRKRAAGITWFPEGFLRTNSGTRRRSRRRGPEGQELRNLSNNQSIPGIETDPNSHHGHVPQWSDDESDMPQPKRFRGNDLGYSSDHTAITEYEEATEPRWTQQHLDAAGIRPLPMLTPPQGNEHIDINAIGPCGITPIMLASIRGGGMDTGIDEDEDDGTGGIIQDLVAQGAKLNATMDNTSETSLCLAARNSRADAAKRLLDAGADANAQDSTGRTPLHAAVAADALGVFQILLRNRATNLNAKMHDGTTPLILAARLAIEGMVQDLISAEADINAADNSGKTALHWAAAVNNVEAVNILISSGANRDAQDDKDETPLFLAAREGSYQACKALLEAYANREITDHMDRLPRDVASERLHHDIVRLLDEHVPRSPQMVNVIPNNNMMTSPTGHMLQQPTVIVPKRQKSKRPSKNSGPTSPEGEGIPNPGSMRRKPSVKKNNNNNNKKNSQHSEIPQSVDSITSTLSPVESPMTNLPSPYDTTSLYTNMGLAQGLESLMGNKQPPSYEDVVKNNLGFTLDNNYGAFNIFQDPLMMQQRQMQANTLSPPYSNQSPPHSVQSNMSLSPQGYNGSPSPAKNRPSLPTSPTHIAAMRAATQQKHGGVPQTQNLQMGFDFSQTGLDIPLTYSGLTSTTPASLHPQQYQQQNYYLTPPSQHSDHLLPENFPTPSPESPGHWSSSSPRSCNSDWSENMASPNTYVSSGHQTNKGSDAIYI